MNRFEPEIGKGLTNIIKANEINNPTNPAPRNWAIQLGHHIEQNEQLSEHVAALFQLWEPTLNIVKVREPNGELRPITLILQDLYVFGKHEQMFKRKEEPQDEM